MSHANLTDSLSQDYAQAVAELAEMLAFNKRTKGYSFGRVSPRLHKPEAISEARARVRKLKSAVAKAEKARARTAEAFKAGDMVRHTEEGWIGVVRRIEPSHKGTMTALVDNGSDDVRWHEVAILATA